MAHVRFAPFCKPAEEGDDLEFDITDGVAVIRLNGTVIEKEWPIGKRSHRGLGLQKKVGYFSLRRIRVKEKE